MSVDWVRLVLDLDGDDSESLPTVTPPAGITLTTLQDWGDSESHRYLMYDPEHPVCKSKLGTEGLDAHLRRSRWSQQPGRPLECSTGGSTSGASGGVGYAVQMDVNGGLKRRIFVPKRAVS
jgi:hypothetical protein